MSSRLSIHFVGLKGVPATFGGVEHVVEEIGARLAARGHDVVVHCRRHYTPPEIRTHRGMRLVREGSLKTKHLDTITHTALGIFRAIGRRPDIISLHNYPNGALALIGRLARVPVILHLHGFEWGLGKWNALDKLILRLLLWPSVAAPTAMTSVSRAQAEYVRRATGRPVLYIPNGVCAPDPSHLGPTIDSTLSGLDLVRNGYVLCVSRLVPQKGVEHLIPAFRKSPLDCPLVIVGDHNHAPDYARALREAAGNDPRIRFLGYRFGDELWSLYAGSRLFVLPTESEGMPLVLLEAMAAPCAILASRIQEIEDVGQSSIEYFRPRDSEDLKGKMVGLYEETGRLDDLRGAASRRAREHHDWDRITDRYEELYTEHASRRRRSLSGVEQGGDRTVGDSAPLGRTLETPAPGPGPHQEVGHPCVRR